MENLELECAAYAVMVAAHEGQTDKQGKPYFLHPKRVAYKVRQISSDADAYTVAAALLHDVVEDTEITLGDLTDIGFPLNVVSAVDALTKRPGETYESQIDRVKENKIAKIVKEADIIDNTRPERLFALPFEEYDRLRRKYMDGLQRLKE